MFAPGGVSGLGGVWSWGCLAQGVWSGGVSGLGGCLVQGVSGPGGVWSRGVSAGQVLPPVNRITDRCKNITLATTSLRPVKMRPATSEMWEIIPT